MVKQVITLTNLAGILGPLEGVRRQFAGPFFSFAKPRVSEGGRSVALVKT